MTTWSVFQNRSQILPERKEKMLQIIHCGSHHHWIVATTIGNKMDAGEVLAYDFIFKNVDRATSSFITLNLRSTGSFEVFLPAGNKPEGHTIFESICAKTL